MSEMEKREDISRYDSMSTEELQEILRKHAHDELDTEPDTDELFKIMDHPFPPGYHRAGSGKRILYH